MRICNKCEDIFVTIVDGVFSGSEICPTCLNTTYKTNKNGEKMNNKKLTLPFGEEDIRLFQELVIYNGEEIKWTFETKCGELIDIEFIKDKEDD